MENIDLKIGGRHIGGSSVGVVMGVNPHEGPLALALHLKGRVPRQFTKEQLDLMRMGNDLEPKIIKRTEEALGIQVFDEDLTYQDRDLPYLVGHLDGKFIYNNLPFVLECKYSVFALQEVPEHYKHQVNWYMGLSHIHRAKLSNLDSRGSFKIFDLSFDEPLFYKQKAAAKRFWERYVEGDELPPADDTSDSALRGLWPYDSGEVLDHSSEMEELLIKRAELLKDPVKKKLDLVNNQIKELLQDNSFYNSEKFGTITYKKTKDSIKWKPLSKVELSEEEQERLTEIKKGSRTLRFPRGFA